MKRTLASIAMATAVALAAMPASAETNTAANTAQFRTVSYADLNLTTAEGQATLQRRLDSAAWNVCQFDTDGMLRTAQDHGSCYRAARKDVAIRVAEITADFQRGG